MGSFGDVLKMIRGEESLTQAMLARRLNIARATIAGYEAGNRPSRGTLDQICEAMPQHEDALREAWEDNGGAAVVPPPGPSTEDELKGMFWRRSRSDVDIEGAWAALWQTVVHGAENRNHEQVTIERYRDSWHVRNLERSAENPDGGYLWHAECRLYDNQFLLGTYISREKNVRSKGVMYLVLHPSGRSMVGHWVGCNYDTPWAQGYFALCDDEQRVDDVLDRHVDDRPPMPYSEKPSGDRYAD